MMPMDAIIVLSMPALAMFYDLFIGERPVSIHPVIYYGRYISFFDKRYREDASKWASRAYGILLLLSLAIASIVPLLILRFALEELEKNILAYLLISIMALYFLKTSFSLKHMVHEARAVNEYVRKEDLDGARGRVSYIVSRKTDELSFENIISANIECVSESFVDSIMSPIFYLSIFGLYGSQFYRAMNSADSRVGYKNERYKDFGLIPAKFDDILNFIPSRLSIPITLLSGWILGHDVKRGWKTYRKYSNCTESPNAGITMSLYSGLIGARLHKEGNYTIGEEFDHPRMEQVEDTVNIYVLSTFITIIIVTIIFMTSLMPLVFL